jgi:hypothetical protein
LRRADVIAAGAVTPLAIDAFGKVALKYRLLPWNVVPGGNPGISIVAENAFVRD